MLGHPGRNQEHFLDEKLLKLCAESAVKDLKSHLQAGLQGRINQGEEHCGSTALHLASKAEADQDALAMAKMLLSHGANPASTNYKRETPVHFAARAGNALTLKFLIESGGFSGILSHVGRHSTHNRHGSAAAASFKQRRRQSIKEKRRSGEHESSSDADNLLAIACESESTECVIILLDEIMNARRSCLLSTKSPVFTSSTPNSTVNGSEGFDVREFLELPEPRQVVFFELGSDLAASNRAVTVKQMEMSIYGLMLTKTPKAFMHLLDSCVYTVGKKTYVDFFPFYNPDGSELSILKVIIHFKKFDLLTHPVCELFLYLKWRRARWLYWIVLILDLIYCLLVITYGLLYYGELGTFIVNQGGTHCSQDQDSSSNGTDSDIQPREFPDAEIHCSASWLRIPVIVTAFIMSLIQVAKLIQDRNAFASRHFWEHRSDELLHVFVILLIILDQLPEDIIGVMLHKIIAAFLVLCSCRIMVHTIARDPDIAIVVEMVTSIQNGFFKFFISYIWLFVGWVVAFHIALGEGERNENGYPNSFHDLGSATAKVMAMFTGELGFETAFSAATNLSTHAFYHFWIIVLYAVFIMEMCIILMNLLIGLAISNIQDLRSNADGLRLIKEVVLQRYLESLLRLISMPKCCGSEGVRRDLGQLITSCQFEGDAVYCLSRLSRSECRSGKLILQLLEKKDGSFLASASAGDGPHLRLLPRVSLPATVVAKLRPLLLGFEREKENCDTKIMLRDLRTEVDNLRLLMTSMMEMAERILRKQDDCPEEEEEEGAPGAAPERPDVTRRM